MIRICWYDLTTMYIHIHLLVGCIKSISVHWITNTEHWNKEALNHVFGYVRLHCREGNDTWTRQQRRRAWACCGSFRSSSRRGRRRWCRHGGSDPSRSLHVRSSDPTEWSSSRNGSDIHWSTLLTYLSTEINIQHNSKRVQHRLVFQLKLRYFDCVYRSLTKYLWNQAA